MKYIELARKIPSNVSDEDVKKALMTRLRRVYVVNNIEERPNGLRVRAMTGNPNSYSRMAQMVAEIDIVRGKTDVRLLAYGHARVAKSLIFSYCALFVIVMFCGLLPGTINTTGHGTAMDALVFLIIGICVFYDIEQKLREPGEYLAAALDSVVTELG